MSREWRFIYVRNPKSSSTAVLGSIKKQLCGGECSEDQLLRIDDKATVAPLWEEYFVFTVVRNPWTRALSAYTMFTNNFLFKCAPHLCIVAARVLPPAAVAVPLRHATVRPRQPPGTVQLV